MGTNLTTALIFVMVLNSLMWLNQVAMININPEGPIYYSCEGSIIDGLGKCDLNKSFINTSDTINQLPTAESSVEPTSGNVFTDTFRSLKNWISKSTGMNYLFGIVSAPYNILKALNLPVEFAAIMGLLWYGITLFLIIAFLIGRDS